jgi:hypothetical protein
VGVAHPERDRAARDVGARLVDHPRQRRGEQVDLHVLPATGAVPVLQGREHPDGGVEAGEHVEDGDAGPVGFPVGVAGEAHQPADGLDDQVVAGQPGTLLTAAEAADRGVDDTRVGLGHGRVVEPEPRERARPEVLEHDVGAGDQPARHVEVVGVLEVQGDRPLVAVDPEEVGRDPVAHRGLPRAGVVALGALDLDHLGAQVAQEHRGVGAGQDPGEVGDQQSRQRSLLRGVGHHGAFHDVRTRVR